jgi:hypothetical protein
MNDKPGSEHELTAGSDPLVERAVRQGKVPVSVTPVYAV